MYRTAVFSYSTFNIFGRWLSCGVPPRLASVRLGGHGLRGPWHYFSGVQWVLVLVVSAGDHASFDNLLGTKYPKVGMKEKYMVKNLCVFGCQYKIHPPAFGYRTALFARGELRRSTGFEP